MHRSRLGWFVAALLLPVLVVGLCIAVYQPRQAAVAEVERLGGRVQTTQGGPEWLRTLLGRMAMRLFDRPTVVNLSDTGIEDSDLAVLPRLSDVERLNLSGTGITDEGLAVVADLARLKALDVSGTRITDAGLARLSSLARLEYLYLSNTGISDAGLVRLEPLTNLRHLAIDGTGATDAGIKRIRSALSDVEIVASPLADE